MSNKPALDAIDQEILLLLARDGRMSNVDLARRVGLTPPPCLRRVRRLEEAGIIAGYGAQVDYTAMGRGFEVVVAVDIGVNDRVTMEKFEQDVIAMPEVVELRRMFGRPDYYIRVAVSDSDAYEMFLTSKLSTLSPVTRVDSHLTMKLFTDTLPEGDARSFEP
ncbi:MULTISPECIES: Lrp/AsnC family transcriptional regulator [Mycetocola]|uniref:Lrp/AsnC family transcriptional regulator n=1 Tax=Mycetocola lacteus TaxID=76637 RepID=A0A3L7ARH9_9MICO|nr:MULTISPECIES: Lrp/AsnC family transcriptional regulator [Mycetocola]MCS4275995.1 DNA-binding Lrp family transcriptional regulator [Mycetocola sp. BIGb0189]RLP82241.1 Lrp/AsnC family transcriptional regulator [Mycetocola lacteus]